MGVISEKFNAKVSALKSDYEVNKDIVHQGIKGGLNENALSSLIKEVIPQKYKISKGIIENPNGEQSNETDFFIYDDEILPPYIKDDLAFVPVEAVKYAFEVKSTLNSTEIKTTIAKFKKLISMGATSPTVLFAFASDFQGSELDRYKKNDDKFYTYPSLMVLCVSNKGYYFKNMTEHYLKDHLSAEEFINKFLDQSNMSIDAFKEALSNMLVNDEILNQMSRSQFALLIQSSIIFNNHLNNIDKKDLTVNGVKYSEIKFKVHKWIGVESSDNKVEMSLLSGVSNTLSKKSFGHYLLNGKVEMKVFSICYEDMWGNLSMQDFDENGLSYDLDNVTYSYTFSSEGHKILFKRKE